MTPLPWQQDILNTLLGRNKHDKFTTGLCGISVPRQNGKNGIIEIRELYGAAINGESILHTAHEVKTARMAFERVVSFFDPTKGAHPDLVDLVRVIRRTNGQEAVELKNGGRIEFSARSRGARRGFSADCLIFDEAQELTDEQYEAVLFVAAASPSDNRQIIMLGTPPGPNVPGEVFPRIRKSILDDTAAESTAWFEWSVEEVGDVSDVNRWYDTNPSMGVLLSEQWTRDTEFVSASPLGFARERLGYWDSFDIKINRVLDANKWDECYTDSPPKKDAYAVGIRFATEGDEIAVAVAQKYDGYNKNGRPATKVHTEIVNCTNTQSDAEIDSIVDWLMAREDHISEVYIDGKNGASELNTALINAGFSKRAVSLVSVGQVIEAATTYRTMVNNNTLSHFNQDILTSSATSATKRSIGTGGGWTFETSDENAAKSTSVAASALAVLAAITTRRDPTRKQTVTII